MKKKIFALVLTLTFSTNVFCFRNFVEKIDYFVEFQEKSPEMAAVLHVNFTRVMPEPEEAEEIVKQQLKIYGNKLILQKKAIVKTKKETKYKNIIGSAWYINEDTAIPIKIKFQKDCAAYVWLGKIKKTVTFPSYISFLKKEIERNKHTDKITEKQLQTQNSEY
jgi:hypothetical protein